jgi:hypothetical protein
MFLLYFPATSNRVLTGCDSRVRYQVSSANPVNFVQESARLAELIKAYHI